MTMRKFSRESKREAVHLVTQRGVSLAQAAEGGGQGIYLRSAILDHS